MRPSTAGHHRFDPGLVGAVSAGGAAGTVLRAAIERALPPGGSGFPWATLLVNIAGSSVIGLVMVVALERAGPSRYFRPLVGTGFCGGLTTFSTFAVETDRLIRAGRVGLAIVYVGVSLAAGLLAVIAAAGMARSVLDRGEL